MFDSACSPSGVQLSRCPCRQRAYNKEKQSAPANEDNENVYTALSCNYAQKNVKAGSSIYILGGFAVVPEIDTALVTRGFQTHKTVQRQQICYE